MRDRGRYALASLLDREHARPRRRCALDRRSPSRTRPSTSTRRPWSSSATACRRHRRPSARPRGRRPRPSASLGSARSRRSRPCSRGYAVVQTARRHGRHRRGVSLRSTTRSRRASRPAARSPTIREVHPGPVAVDSPTADAPNATTDEDRHGRRAQLRAGARRAGRRSSSGSRPAAFPSRSRSRCGSAARSWRAICQRWLDGARARLDAAISADVEAPTRTSSVSGRARCRT